MVFVGESWRASGFLRKLFKLFISHLSRGEWFFSSVLHFKITPVTFSPYPWVLSTPVASGEPPSSQSALYPTASYPVLLRWFHFGKNEPCTILISSRRLNQEPSKAYESISLSGPNTCHTLLYNVFFMSNTRVVTISSSLFIAFERNCLVSHSLVLPWRLNRYTYQSCCVNSLRNSRAPW